MREVDESVYQIRTHLLYELKWMIFAAARFEKALPGDPYVALIDSAAVHARNLFEFVGTKQRRDHFTLEGLGGTRQNVKAWQRWANNRVAHMLQREHDRAPWPDGLDNDRNDRFIVMAGVVLTSLTVGGESIRTSDIKHAFDLVVGAARAYWVDPTEDQHQALAALHDASRDTRPY